MKLSRYSILPLACAILLGVGGCTEPEKAESRAIMTSESTISLKAEATTRNLTIYADGTWKAAVTEDWLSIDTTEGWGTMDVVLTVDENFGKESRQGKIIVSGSSTISDVEIVINQKFDRFREITAVSVTDALSLKVGDLAKVSECTVMAKTNDGAIVSDGKSNMYIETTESVKIGDRVTFGGDVAAFGSMTEIKVEDLKVISNSSVTYPQPVDITSNSTTYASDKVEYVKFTGSFLAGGKLAINGKPRASICNVTSDFDVLLKRDAEFLGYYVGKEGKVVVIAVVSFTDKGETPPIVPLYSDNFDWVAPFVQWDKDNGRTQGDSMAKKATVNYGNAYAIPGFEDMFTGTMKYESLFYSSKTVYVCEGNYLKFSKTNNCNGVRLPAVAIDGTDDITLTFDWGKNTTDNVILVVEVEGNGTINGEKVSSELKPTGAFEWKTETIVIEGADSETRIKIYPTAFCGEVTTDGSLYRWFLDNVEIW
ncbi:MAG: BACON domain-containing protein [Candidatus Cryptobacteroides sp.]